MLIAVAFWLFLAASCLIVALDGQAPERLFVALVVLATLCTALGEIFASSAVAQVCTLAIDYALLALGLAYVARHDAFWPVWFCGFHFVTAATDLAIFAFPNNVPGLYADAAGFWALPALGATALGVTLDARQRVRSDCAMRTE